MTRAQEPTAVLPDDEQAQTRIQWTAMIVGVAFIVVGILGFIPGVTTGFHGSRSMAFSGLHAHAMLFGVFRVSVFHNGVHLLLGLIGMVSSFKPLWARWYLFLAGVVYLALCIFGFVVDRASSANFVPVNSADNWLHLVLAVALIVLGVVVGRSRAHH
jgi:hypothetical protein